MKNLIGILIIAASGGIGYLIGGDEGGGVGIVVGFIIAAIVRRLIG